MSNRTGRTASDVTAILYTFSWNGFSVRFADGKTESYSPEALWELADSEERYHQWNRVAHTFPCNCYKNV